MELTRKYLFVFIFLLFFKNLYNCVNAGGYDISFIISCCWYTNDEIKILLKSHSRLLSKEGATIIAADRKLADAEDTVAELKSKDGVALPVDVSRSISVIQLLDSVVNHYKRPPTIVVNSAGIIRDHYLLKMSEPDFDVVLDVNLKGTFLMMQYFGMRWSHIDEGQYFIFGFFSSKSDGRL